MAEFCPVIKELCENGYPGDTKCILWDTDSQTCLYLENIRRIAGITKKWSGISAPKPTRLKSGVEEAKLSELLKDFDLDGSED